MIELGGGFTVNNADELSAMMKNLQGADERKRAGEAAKLYVEKEKGATGKIMEYINTLIH